MEHDPELVIPAGYAEYPPPPDLAAHVACFWTSVAMPGVREVTRPVRRVLPDGCVDIIVALRGDDGDASAVGAMTRPLILSETEPDVHIGVRFRPGHAYAALRVPADELTDDQVSYNLLTRDAEAEVAAIRGQPTNAARLQAMIRLVRRRLTGAPEVPLSIQRAVHLIAVDHGNLRVRELASAIGITRQQLARQFATHVGVTPKTLARVMRARAALARADAARAAHPRNIDWSAIAYDLGYYDQPHFIDDFKTITGSTPGRWYGEDLERRERGQ
jgi:AraC-like DNA-binding protein